MPKKEQLKRQRQIDVLNGNVPVSNGQAERLLEEKYGVAPVTRVKLKKEKNKPNSSSGKSVWAVKKK